MTEPPTDLYYIVLRSSGRQPIFTDDEDRRLFTQVVANTAQECGVAVYAYCLLETEARLAVKRGALPVSHFAQRLTDQHTRRLEREISLTGSHFEQKYRGVQVDGETALLDLVRHIHLAPLKAGLTDDLADYIWSSHRAYMGLTSAPWLDKVTVMSQFEHPSMDPRWAYIDFMLQGMDDPPQADESDAEGAEDGAEPS
jgi:REP-associated tyrosine transposase